MKSQNIKVLISAGGSGGHLFPMISVAQAIRLRHPEAVIEFVGTRQGLEARVVPEQHFNIHFISIKGVYRSGLKRKLMALYQLPLAVMKAMLIIWRLKPHLVFGSGSYTSGPVMLAALLMRRRTALQEQNASPGLTNRLLGRYVDLAVLAVAPKSPEIFRNYVVTGNPIRKEIHQLSLSEPEISENPVHICLVGGSKGAHKLNVALCGCVAMLEKKLGSKISLLHQTGAADFEAAVATYEACSLDAKATAFIDNMPDVYRKASLIISRAGSTVFEFLAAGKPSILIPIPWSSGGHQQSNAELLAEHGAACILHESELSSESLFALIEELVSDPSKLKEMGRNARKLYKGDGVEQIVNELEKFFPAEAKAG